VTTTRTLIALTAAALITAGCGGPNVEESAPANTQPTTVNPTDMPNEQAPPSRLVIEVTIKGGTVTPTNEQLQAAIKQQIVIRVDSDVADELHVHSNPEHTFKVEAKPAQSFQFTADAPGKVDVELHQLKQIIATIQVQ
jgi:ABC-type glycerol-3-phosphate transport system substrate-binding protein